MNQRIKFSLLITLLIIATGTGVYLFKSAGDKTNENSTGTVSPTTKTEPSQPLIVGTAGGYAPFVSLNAQSEYEGFDIDVARALAQQLNRPLEIRDLGSMAPLFMALEQGSIDLIIWGLSITPERLQKVAMVHYWGDNTTAFPLIFWNQIPAQIKSINDLSGQTVCVEPASVQEAVLRKYPQINPKFTEKVDDALLNIQYGKADAALVEPAIAQKFQRKYPEIKILEVPLAPADQIQGLGIAIKSNNAELITQVQQAVQKLSETGVIKSSAEKWNI